MYLRISEHEKKKGRARADTHDEEHAAKRMVQGQNASSSASTWNRTCTRDVPPVTATTVDTLGDARERLRYSDLNRVKVKGCEKCLYKQQVHSDSDANRKG